MKMRIYAVQYAGRRHYRMAVHDSKGVLVVFLPTHIAHKMLRNLAGIN